MRGLACLCLPAFRGIASDEAPPSSVVGRGLGAPWRRGLRLTGAELGPGGGLTRDLDQ